MSHSRNTNPVPPEFVRDRLLTAQEAAAIFSYSASYFRLLSKIGRLPKPIQGIGYTDRWHAGSLLDFIAEKAKAAA